MISEAEAFAAEREWVARLSTRGKRGYNMYEGGGGVAEHLVPPVTRASLSAAAKAQWSDPVFRAQYLADKAERDAVLKGRPCKHCGEPRVEGLCKSDACRARKSAAELARRIKLAVPGAGTGQGSLAASKWQDPAFRAATTAAQAAAGAAMRARPCPTCGGPRIKSKCRACDRARELANRIASGEPGAGQGKGSWQRARKAARLAAEAATAPS
jgi:hypothetical protein